VYNRKWWMIRY